MDERERQEKVQALVGLAPWQRTLFGNRLRSTGRVRRRVRRLGAWCGYSPFVAPERLSLIVANVRASHPQFCVEAASSKRSLTGPPFEALKPYENDGVQLLLSRWHQGRNGWCADTGSLPKLRQVVALMAIIHERFEQAPFLLIAPDVRCAEWHRLVILYAPALRCAVI